MRSHRVASGLVGGLALLTIAACTPVEEIPDETATASPSPTAPPAVPAPAPAAPGVPFAEPVVAPASPGIEGLVPVVNPVERLQQIRSGRTDPFASTQTVGIQVSVTQPPEPPVPIVPPPDGGGTAPTPPPFPTPGTPGFPGSPGGVSPFPTAPLGPQPDLARAVEVTGVVQVGDVPRAIIQAPNEATSRYVVAGQRVANGRVLVKRIEANQFPSPVVILEEHGIEVIKAVGETAETAETAG